MSKMKTAKRTAIGGGILGLALFIAYLLNNLPNVGTSDQEFQSAVTNNNPEPQEQPDVQSATNATNGQIPGDVVTVVISDRDYYVRLSDDSERKMDLPQVISHVQQATGDASGFRVRILKREDARASASDQLDAELKQAGIAVDSIHRQYELLKAKEN